MTSAERLLARLGKFNLVGMLGAALQLLLLYLLTKGFHMSAVAATPVAVEIVVLHNWAWHERFTWRDRQCKGIRQRITRLLRFHASNGLTSLAGNTVLAYCLVERLSASGAAFGHGGDCHLLVNQFFHCRPLGIHDHVTLKTLHLWNQVRHCSHSLL